MRVEGAKGENQRDEEGSTTKLRVDCVRLPDRVNEANARVVSARGDCANADLHAKRSSEMSTKP